MRLNIYILYINFILFLEGQLRDNVLKGNSVYKSQYIGNILCALVYKPFFMYTNNCTPNVAQHMNFYAKLQANRIIVIERQIDKRTGL